MTSFSFKDIHTQFCEKIDKLQVYNNFTVSLSLKRLAIADCIHFIKFIKLLKYQAINRGNSYEADHLFHMQCFLNSLLSSLSIWILLHDKQFKKAWDSLIDAQEYLSVAKKIHEYEGLKNFEKHLDCIEKSIFPKRKIYLSSAFTSTIGNCSICGNEFSDCIHIENNIYCGQLCYRVNIKNIEGNHVALAENPKDRRSIITSYGQENLIIDSFTLEKIDEKDEIQEGIFHGCILSIKKLDWN